MRFSPIKLLHGLLYTAPVILLTLVACGGGGSTPPASPFLGGYTVGGAVVGLTGDGLVLRLNGGNDLTIASAVLNYVFTTRIINGSSYIVTVLTHPSAPVQVCTLASAASGIMPSTNVADANVTCVPAFTIGGTIVSVASGVPATSGIGPILLNNNGDSHFIASITPTPASFVFSVPVASGASYAVTQLSRARSPTQNCTVSPASGVASASSVNEVTIQCSVVKAVPKFAYVTNSASNVVSAYTIATSGVLTYKGATPTGSRPYSVTVDPSGRFAYVANLNSHTISAYSIAASGVLAEIDANGAVTGTQDSIATGTGPISVTVHPSGKFAYVVNGGAGGTLIGDSISAYSINVTTGALSAIDADGAPGTQATIATGSEPRAIAVDPTGRFAYVANYGSGSASHTVSAYTLDQTTGALTNAGSSVPGTGPISIAIDPTGKFVYVANSNSNDVSAYTSASGVLTAASGAIAAETAPRSVAVADTTHGMYAYVANATSNTVSAYTIDTGTGELTAAASAVAAGTTPVSINVDPSGQFVYVANFGSNDVSVYSIGAGGVLTAASAVATGGGPTSVTTTQ